MITKNIIVGGGNVAYQALLALNDVPSKLIDIDQVPYVIICLEWGGIDYTTLDMEGWENFKLNLCMNSILWYPQSYNESYKGNYLGCYENGAITIIIRPEDSTEELTLRVWHELLHYYGQPADDMDDLIHNCISKWEWVFYPVLKYLRKNYYQRKFYEYLTELI